MGSLKNQSMDEQGQAEAAWSRKAENQNHRCSVCGELIVYGDREAFFKTGQCDPRELRAAGRLAA